MRSNNRWTGGPPSNSPPTVGSKLQRKDDKQLTYVAAGTAPRNRNDSASPKNHSPLNSAPPSSRCTGFKPANYPKFESYPNPFEIPRKTLRYSEALLSNPALVNMRKELEEQNVSPPMLKEELMDGSVMSELSSQVWQFHNKICQSEKTLASKLSLRDLLYYAISPVFPMCGLYVVGSSLNGFGNDSSDMDLCLMITNKELDQRTDAVVVLNMVLNVLQQMEWVTHQKLILAKVPILQLKFAAPYKEITVDLNVNNSVAVRNTHLLSYYSSYDWRVRPLVSIVKEWAKKKEINDAKRSSFTSYSLVLMVVHYLQCGTCPPILPSLQQHFPRKFSARVDVRSLNVTSPLVEGDEYHLKPKTTLGELLIGFFKYFSMEFDYDAQAISIREGRAITREQVTKCRPNYFNAATWRSQWRCVCIEEPFTSINTAHSIYDEMVFSAIKKAFNEAYEELEKTKSIDCLLNCKPIPVSPPVHGAKAYICQGGSKEATLESRMIVIGHGQSPKMVGGSCEPLGMPTVAEISDISNVSDGEDTKVCDESPPLIELSPIRNESSADGLDT